MKAYDNKAASDTMAPPAKVNSMQALMRLRPPVGSEWSVVAYTLNRDIIHEDGTVDDLYGVVFPLGSFHDKKEAEKHAKSVIELSKHPGVSVVRYGYPKRLTPKFDPNTVIDVPLDMKGKLMELESAQYKREREEYERRAKIERDIMKESEEETNPDSIEHFKRQVYLAIKNRATYQYHSREADTAWANYKKREAGVREHYRRHPEHETVWLPYLREKLIERGELPLYDAMVQAYNEIRTELLDIPESSTNIQQSNTQVSCSNAVSTTSKAPDPSDNVQASCSNGVCTKSTKSPHKNVQVSRSNEVCPVSSSKAPSENVQMSCTNGVCTIASSSKPPRSAQKAQLSCSNGVCTLAPSTNDDIISAEDLSDDENGIISPDELGN